MDEHVLYTAEDFRDLPLEELDNNKTYELVVEGGLSICKVCGEYEAGLDEPCVVNRGFDIEITCNNCKGTNLNVTLNGPYQVLNIYCYDCPNTGEESI